MRIVNAIFCLVLALFAVVQYNDPDVFLWASIYGLGAVFTGIAAFRPALFVQPGFRIFYLVALAASLGGLAYYWPDTPHWWWKQVWWETETAREGMGMMILFVAMLAAGTVVMRARRQA